MRTIILILVAIVAVAGGLWYINNARNAEQMPETGMQPETTVILQAAYHNATPNNIVIDTPKPGATVPRSFTVSGKARGNWYFEASFPIRVLIGNSEVLFEGPVQAEGEWMTTEFVPFSTTITIPGSYTGPATLVLHNDNASGLPEHDRAVSMPIVIQ